MDKQPSTSLDSFAELMNKHDLAFCKVIAEDTYRLVNNEENRGLVVESALKELQKTNPKATLKEAETLADMMKLFSRMFIDEVNRLRSNQQ